MGVHNGHAFHSLPWVPACVCDCVFVFTCVCVFSSSAMPTSQTGCLTQMSVIWAVWNTGARILWPMAAELTVRLRRGLPSASITSRASNAAMWPDTWARSEHAYRQLTQAHTLWCDGPIQGGLWACHKCSISTRHKDDGCKNQTNKQTKQKKVSLNTPQCVFISECVSIIYKYFPVGTQK